MILHVAIPNKSRSRFQIFTKTHQPSQRAGGGAAHFPADFFDGELEVRPIHGQIIAPGGNRTEVRSLLPHELNVFISILFLFPIGTRSKGWLCVVESQLFNN